MNPFKYYVAAFSSFFMWGFFTLAIKPLAAYASFDILFFRIVFSTLLIVVFSLFFRKDKMLTDFINTERKEKKICH